MHEALYDTKENPEETVNLAGRKEYAEILQTMRTRRERVIDLTPTAQTRWAPLVGEG